jgi:HJR/Mrr/RecB family endonuclease
VECKKYSPSNKVCVRIIREVAGVHFIRKPSKSIIVTTSYFTTEAIKEARLIENELDLKDFNGIKEWLDKY